jgi:acyl-CoA thioesterase-2
VNGLDFLGLEPTDDPNRWRLPVHTGVLSGMGALFGGCGLAAAVEAMERSTGRPTVWASAQYLSFARPPAVVDIEVVAMVTGRRTSQARAIGRVDDDEIFTVNAALGTRPDAMAGQWAVRPEVPPPDACPPRTTQQRHRGTLFDRLEMRRANARDLDELPGPPGDGRSALWARIPGLDHSITTLGILGDLVPFGISQALGERAGGNSLDNSIRVARRVPTEWLLLDVRIHAVAHGFGHGLVHMWAEDGSLLATASQSAIVRPWKEGPS